MNVKYSLSYVSFKKANLGNPFPPTSKVLRARFKAYGKDAEGQYVLDGNDEKIELANPTLEQIIDELNPNILQDSVRLYQGDEFVIVPIMISSRRVEIEGKKSSEIEEINELARMEAMAESAGASDELPEPRTTIFTHVELESFDWDESE